MNSSLTNAKSFGQESSFFSTGLRLWSALFLSALIWSSLMPKDRFTWWLEVIPALIGACILLSTRKSFRLTTLVYVLLLLHCIILFVGGKYTYAEVPLFNWLRDIFHQSRNNYDKVGHLAQGFIPAMVARELLWRRNIVSKKGWLAFLVICIALAISALYELIEWGAALATGEAADAFLGTQGYVWDTQSDMLMALIGAILALISLSHWHDRQMEKLRSK